MSSARVFIGLTALSSVSLSACASLGTNISGSFDCKAPGGSCAPTAQIDAAAIKTMLDTAPLTDKTRRAPPANSTRTGEHLLRIVFPGFIDARGNLHEARIVHVVARSPDWKAAMTRQDDSNIARHLAREIANHSKSSKPGDADESSTQEPESDEARPVISGNHSPYIKNSYHLPSRSSVPLTAREAIAGANMPAIEGFDGVPPTKSRTPHLDLEPAKDGLPSIEAIEAAKAADTEKRAEKEKGQ